MRMLALVKSIFILSVSNLFRYFIKPVSEAFEICCIMFPLQTLHVIQ